LGDYRQATRVFQTVVEDLDAENRRHNRCGLPGFPTATDRSFLAERLAQLTEFDEGLRYVTRRCTSRSHWVTLSA
jgi:hypothetical protein